MKARRLAPALCLVGLSACAGVPRLFVPSDALTAGEHYRLGSAYEAQGLPDDAARQYLAAVRLAPADPEFLMASGNLRFKRGDFAGAERDFLRARSLAPLHVGAENNLAMAYLAQDKRLPEAERLAREALGRTGPLRPCVLDTLSKIYEREGRLPEARAAAAESVAAARDTP